LKNEEDYRMLSTETARTYGSAQPGTKRCSPVIELRQYTLFPGTGDAFVDLFDRELVETQEAVGMRAIGQFRDLGDPNRFIWMRGFPDMAAREQALTAFYIKGDAWRQHGETARSKMIDSSDALLLHPVRPDAAFALARAEHRPPIESELPRGIVLATIHSLRAPADADLVSFFEGVVAPALIEAGARVLGLLATEHSPNNFPRLPLREGENVLISYLGFSDLEAYHDYMIALGRDPRWRTTIYPDLVRRLQTRPQILRLAPTSRSQLRA
jgi:hypothetical protein